MRLQVVILSDSSHRPKAKVAAPPLASFLEISPGNISLEELSERITDRYRRLYPHNRPLNIQRLQDSEGNDLDLTYIVNDVFDDKSTDKSTSIVKVVHKDVLRDDSVPPESLLRPGSTKKRPIQSLAPLQEEVGEEEGDGIEHEGRLEEEEEEEIGVPVALHRSKRQRIGSPEQSESDSDEDEKAAADQAGRAVSSGKQPAIKANGSSVNGSGVRSPSLGPDLPIKEPHYGLQALPELLSPKEENFSSPPFPAAGLSSNQGPHQYSSEINSSPEPEVLDGPVIAPHTLKNPTSQKPSAPAQLGKLARPNRPNKKPSPRQSLSAYEVEDSSEEEAEDTPAAKPTGRNTKLENTATSTTTTTAPIPLTKKASPGTGRPRGRPKKNDLALEVPSSQPPSFADFHLSSPTSSLTLGFQLPHVESMIGHEKRISKTGVSNVEELIGSKERSMGPPLLPAKAAEAQPPKQNTPMPAVGRKGSKQPEKPPAKTKANLQAPKNTPPRSTTPQSIQSDTNDKNDSGKEQGTGSKLLLSALKDPERRFQETKKSVTFANEGKPTSASSPQEMKPEAKETRKPRTTVKIPAPIIPPELRGIGNRETAEARRVLNEFVGRAKRGSSSTPEVGRLPNGIRVVGTKSATPEVRPASTIKSQASVAGKRIPQPVTTKAKSKSASPLDKTTPEDEEMEDAPPLPTKPTPRAAASSKPLSKEEKESSSEISESSSEEDSEEDSESEDEKLKKDVSRNPGTSGTKHTDQTNDAAASDSDTESESGSDADSEDEAGAAVDVGNDSDSNDDDYEESTSRTMTREESPVKGPGKRQLRSSSPEKKEFVRFTYNTAPSKAYPETAPETPSGSSDSDESSEEEDNSGGKGKANQGATIKAPLQRPIKRAAPEQSDEEKESDKLVPKSQGVQKKLAQSSESSESDGTEEDSSDEEDSEHGSSPPPQRIPSKSRSPSVARVSESPVAVKSKPGNLAAKTAPSKSDSDSDSDSSDSSSSGSEAPTNNGPRQATDTTAQAVSSLFRKERQSQTTPTLAPSEPRSSPRAGPGQLLSGNPRTVRFSKTPEPHNAGGGATASFAKLPASRMNRKSLGYISPSPGPPPSSMPARLPSMVPGASASTSFGISEIKRRSLNTHYKGLSSLSQQDIPETRDSVGPRKPCGPAVGSQQVSAISKKAAFENMISASQRRGKDSDEDDDSGDDSSDSSDDDDADSDDGDGAGKATKGNGQSKQQSSTGLLSFLPTWSNRK